MGKKNYKGRPVSERSKKHLFSRFEEDGEPRAVARPEKAQRALEIAKSFLPESAAPGEEVMSQEDWKRMGEQLNAECGPYVLIGFLSTDGKSVLDENKQKIDEVQLGDSFVRASEWVTEH